MNKERDMEAVLVQLVQKFPVVGLVLMILGSLVVLATAYVKATKSLADDEKLAKAMAHPILGKIIGAVAAFSVIQLKAPAIEAPKAE
jgi:hypothetical protein